MGPDSGIGEDKRKKNIKGKYISIIGFNPGQTNGEPILILMNTYCCSEQGGKKFKEAVDDRINNHKGPLLIIEPYKSSEVLESKLSKSEIKYPRYLLLTEYQEEGKLHGLEPKQIWEKTAELINSLNPKKVDIGGAYLETDVSQFHKYLRETIHQKIKVDEKVCLSYMKNFSIDG